MVPMPRMKNMVVEKGIKWVPDVAGDRRIHDTTHCDFKLYDTTSYAICHFVAVPNCEQFQKFTDIFLEIVPMLMLGFVICSIMAAFYDLDERVAIFLAIFMSPAYFKIFSEKSRGFAVS